MRPHPILRNSAIPRVKSLFKPINAIAIENEFLSQLEEFIKHACITVLPLEGTIIGAVVDTYFNHLPPFGAGKNKAEFPDALALEALKQWCRVQGRSMAVVTRDEGVKAACSDAIHLYYFEDLPQYLDAVSSENETLSAFIRGMVPHHHKKIFKKAKKAFPGLGFFLTDQDGDVEQVELISIQYDSEIKIISLTVDEAIIEMPATLTYKANVSYYEPGTGYYDSEDGVYFLQDTVEAKVTRTAHRSIGVEVTFEDLDGESFQVHSAWYEGKQDIGVRSDYDEDWPYK
jgi:hypothetical protein